MEDLCRIGLADRAIVLEEMGISQKSGSRLAVLVIVPESSCGYIRRKDTFQIIPRWPA